MTSAAVRDSKGKFIKGHPVFPGTERTRFTADSIAWNKHPRFINGKWSYDRFKKDKCEDCNSDDDLQVHHLNQDRTDNRLENLRTVCRLCHWRYHKGKIPWNKGKLTGPLSQEHKNKISNSVRKFYEN